MVAVAKFLDVTAGLQPNQFAVGSKEEIASISDLDDTYKQLMDKQLNRIWQKYIGGGDEYGLHDPAIEERRTLFECRVDKIATFGQPG